VVDAVDALLTRSSQPQLLSILSRSYTDVHPREISKKSASAASLACTRAPDSRRRQPSRARGFYEEQEPNAWNEAELSDADFYRQLRADIESVQAGVVPSIADTEHKVRQMRPWSKKRHLRDRYGNRIH
jgi:hypothetical protein